MANLVFLGFLLLFTPIATGEDEDAKPAFVPSDFQVPSVPESTHFFTFFPHESKINQIWLTSTAKKDGVDSEIEKYDGVWEIGLPTEVAIYNDAGLIVRSKARHHAIAAKLNKPFTFDKDSTLVMQYEVKYEEGQECGGGYVKLLNAGSHDDLKAFNDKTPYSIMFGPDKCGTSGKVHLIFRYKNPINGSVHEHHAKQPSNLGTTYWDDHKTHLYTLILKPDGYFQVLVDEREIIRGNILHDVTPPIEPPKEIFDPSDKKPADWDDREEIPDETASKPDDWDENAPKEIVDGTAEKPSDWLEDEPELIPDPSATKPSDWDNELDGEWEPPQIDNPACKGVSGCGPWKQPVIPNPKYKGKWVRPKVKNPAYKGVWTPKLIPNPHYFEPGPFDGIAPIHAIGIELWTMSKDIIFDNVLLCDSEETATEVAKQTYRIRKAEEARLAASQGEGSGIFNAFIEAANERPWLWAVYVLALLIPILLIGVCCFGRKSSSTKHHKKTDAYQDDDTVPLLVDEDGEEVDEHSGKEDGNISGGDEKRRSRSGSKSPARKSEKPLVTPQAMKDLEESDGSEEGSQGASEEDEEVDVEGVTEEVEETETKQEQKEQTPPTPPPAEKSPSTAQQKPRRRAARRE